jgi:hypothetical protein
MNARIQNKIDEIKKLSTQSKTDRPVSYKTVAQTKDGLSVAIRTQKDADTFMAELKAIGKKKN